MAERSPQQRRIGLLMALGVADVFLGLLNLTVWHRAGFGVMFLAIGVAFLAWGTQIVKSGPGR